MPDSSFSIKKVVEARGSTAAALAVEAFAPNDPQLLTVLLGAPLADADVELGKITLGGEAGRSVVLGRGKTKAEFKASAGAHGRFGVYASGTDVLAALGIDAAPIGGLQLPDDADRRFAVVDWGYEGAVGGGIALQGKAATRIEGDARRTARYIVLRSLASDMPGKKAIAETLGSLILPFQVTSPDDIRPGSWVISEVDGSLGIKVGAQYGYSLDWVREAASGGLSGDIGLKIQAGIDVALGFSAAGRFLIAVSRPGLTGHSKTIRVQVFKMKRKGWDFAMNASATVEPVAKILPETFEGFLGGVLGIDGSQLLKDLKSVRRHLDDPAGGLEALLGQSLSVQALLEKIAPGATSVVERYAQAWASIDGLLKKWDTLEHDVAALLWSKMGDSGAIQSIRSFAAQLTELDVDGVRDKILERLTGSASADDPVLQWLSAVLDGTILSALSQSRALKATQAAARRTTELLDAEGLGVVLDGLHGYIDEALSLDRVRQAIAAGSVESLDQWLTARLETFIGAAADAVHLAEVGKVIDLLEEKSPEFYAKARAALERKYEASFALTYKRATERTALVDVEIDGSHADASKLLGQAISGEFGRFLMEAHPAVTLRIGALTHGVERRTSVAVALPFFSRDVKTFTKSLAKVAVSDEPGGRVALYSLDAENTVERDNVMRSRLSISGSLEVASNAVTRWSEPEWMSTYEFAESFPDVRRAVLAHRLEPLVDTYFEEDFPAGPKARSVSNWLDDWDLTIGGVMENGTDNFGNTVMRLSVALPAKVGQAWLGAKGSKSDPAYRAMSLEMQTTMRRVMLRVADAKTRFYESNFRRAYSLLVYAAMPPAHGARILKRGGVSLFNASDVHWKWEDRKLLEAILDEPITRSNLAVLFSEVHRRLAHEGKVAQNILRRFEPTPRRLDDAIEDALDQPTAGLSDLQKLLFVEEAAVRNALEAGQAMAQFRRVASSDAASAVEALAGFGEKTTRAFNEQLKKSFGDDALPALSAELFAAAARGFDPSLVNAKSLAMLEIMVLREDAPFPPATLDQQSFADDVVLAQRFVRG